MGQQDGLKKRVKFGSGQPTNLGGRPKKIPFSDELKTFLEGDGWVEFKPEMVRINPTGTYSVKMPNQQMVATKFMQKLMSGDPRFMEMYMKLFGEYEPEKHNVNVNQPPLQGINFDKLSAEQIKVLKDIAQNG